MLVRRIYEWAQTTPAKTALVYCGIPFSYRAFALRIEHARQTLGRQPLRPGSIAAIRLDSRLDAWIFALALRSLGMVTVAVRSLDQVDALGLEDLGCVIAAAGEEPVTRLRTRSRPYFVMQTQTNLYLGDPGGELPDPRQMTIRPGAHIMLTSGTTGTFKTAPIDDTIAAIRQPVLAAQCGFTDRSVICLFDFGLWTAPGMMACTVWDVGGAVVIEQRADLYPCVADPAVTYAHATPGILTRLLASAPHDALLPRDTLSIGVGGGTPSAALAEEVRARLTPNLFVHVASTEVGIWCITPIKTAEDLGSHCVAAGREVQVVDEAERPLPRGQVGRIRIRTIDGATGYFGDEEAWRASFRNGFFYPGDLGFFQADGRLVLQGRMTDIVNIQGNKIAPEPVERALQARLGVEAGSLISLAKAGSDEELHVAIQSSRSIDRAELAAAWNSAIRNCPQPQFHIVAALPRNEAGKIQRSVLREQILAGRAH
jgi:acyl-CoA synthetase (AMP-forming)/AMP-acid ligase II